MRKIQPRATDMIAIASLFALLIAGAFNPALQAQSTAAQQSTRSAESPNDLFVTIGKSVLVDSELPIERVSTGYGDIADATAVGPREVMVNGKKTGETSLIIWQQGGGKLFFDVTVRPSRFVANDRLDTLNREMKKELPGQKIDLSFENDLVFLRGTVKNLTSADRAVTIASTMGKVVNLLYVDVPPPDAQILLKVRFASVDRNLSRQLGMNLFSTGATNTIGTATTQQFSPPSVTHTPGVTQFTLSDALNLFFFRPDLNLGATIKALEVKGLLQTLAEPNVLAQDGKQASFLAGGEFPFPTVQGVGGGGGAGAVTIQFREFGVRLNFIPTITPRGTIRLQVAPEVSALDFTNGLNIQGFNVPALTIRKVKTEIELKDGQSFAIGGLLDNRETETFEKIPFIGDVPLLGKFFQSKSLNKQNTELIVIVTPELVRPIPVGQPLPGVNYPKPFLPPNTGKPMTTPGVNVTGPVPVTPPTPSIPVETLLESLKPEAPLVVTSSSGSTGLSSGQQAMSAAGAAPSAAPATAPTSSPQ